MTNKKLSLLFFLIFAFSSILVTGQIYDLKLNPPLDSSVRTGKLKNGLTYYIKSNKLPENRAEFYIVHNVGAILEDDNQNGLAHFTEHMAFNGTKNFPKKEMLNYLETIGCKFGQNVNAFTSMDETCYNISSVPLTRDGIIDTCLLVLHDWSSYISFEPEEIESERGVIMEEWRTRGGAWSRINDKQRPIMYKDSKYGQRNVIGDTAIIKHFTDKDIKDYYHKWYRPDLQAVIIVGNFDVEMMEAKVKDVFSSIPVVKNPTTKPFYDIPDNENPLIAIATDPEATNINLNVYFKHNRIKPENKNLEYLRLGILQGLINQMLNARMTEILQNPDAPCTRAYSYYSGYTNAKEAFITAANVKNNQVIPSLELLLTESKRMQQHGFIQSELDRAKSNNLRAIQSAFLDKDKQKHNSYVWEYFGHFTSNEPSTGIDYYKNFANSVIPNIKLDEINQLAKSYITENNIVITLSAPEKEGVQIPNENELLAVLQEIKSQQTKPYVENLVSSSLLEIIPQKGTIVSEKKVDQFGVIEWELSNGMKVVLKTTDFKEDQFTIKGISKGGCFNVPDSCYLATSNIGRFVGEMGLGNFSKTDLTKILSGKRAYTQIGIGDDSEQINGGGSPQDLETVLQMIYQRFTQPRFDEDVFKTVMSKYKTDIENRTLEPSSAFSDSITMTLLNHHPLRSPVTLERLNEITFDKIKRYYHDRFMVPDQFTWIVVGNVKADVLKPLLETYLASLPSGNRHETYIDKGIRMADGNIQNRFEKEMKNLKTSVFNMRKGNMSYLPENFIYLDAIKHVLDIKYVETIREKEGGSYGVNVGKGYDKEPLQLGYIYMSFDTDPQKADRMIEILHQEFNNILENPPSEENVQKAKEFFLKTFADNVKENWFWTQQLTNYYFNDIDTYTSYPSLVEKLTPESIHAFAQKTFSNDRVVEVIMQPISK